MPKTNRIYKKKTGHFRDATYNLIIGEGKTEPQYFTGLLPYISEESRKRIKLRILPQEKVNDLTATKHLIERAIDFRESISDFTKGRDSVYIIADKGEQSHSTLMSHFETCENDNINLIISTPCFEIWLLLHVSDLSQTTFSIQPYHNGKPSKKAEQNCKKELRQIMGSYNEANIIIRDYLPHTNLAIERAKERENTQEKYPFNIGTRVYKIVEKLQIRIPSI